MEDMFKLSRRKGSAKWQVRKRWPSDVATVLSGEFNASTGEEDRKLAQQRLPMISAEYERRVAEARDKLAAQPRESLTEAEAHRMAAEFYRKSLPMYVVRRTIDPASQQQLITTTSARLTTLKTMLGRNEFGPVMAAARTMTKEAGLVLPEGSPSHDYLHRMLMRAFVELHATGLASLSGDTSYTSQDSALEEAPAPKAGEAPNRTIEALIGAYREDKWEKWSGSSRKAVGPVFRLLEDVFPGREVTTITREDARSVVKLLEGLPVNLGKRKELKGLTVPQAVEKARALGLPIIQPKTINDAYLLHIASMFNWARKEQWVTASPL